MKTELQNLLGIAVAHVVKDAGVDINLPALEIERTRDIRHGHFASNVAMRLANALQQPPRAIPDAIVAALPAASIIAATEIAGPGFINFRLTDAAFHDELHGILKQAEKYGHSALGKGKKILLPVDALVRPNSVTPFAPVGDQIDQSQLTPPTGTPAESRPGPRPRWARGLPRRPK